MGSVSTTCLAHRRYSRRRSSDPAVVEATWTGALRYCGAQSKRLPIEAECLQALSVSQQRRSRAPRSRSGSCYSRRRPRPQSPGVAHNGVRPHARARPGCGASQRGIPMRALSDSRQDSVKAPKPSRKSSVEVARRNCSWSAWLTDLLNAVATAFTCCFSMRT